MEEKVNQILADLYNLDPAFRKHEDQLVGIITSLLEAKPDTKFDEDFAEGLRRRLMTQDLRIPQPSRGSLLEIKHAFFRRMTFAGALTAVFLVVIATTLYVNRKNGSQITFLSPGVRITQAGERAFGELNQLTVETPKTTDSAEATADSKQADNIATQAPLGLGGGGGSDIGMIVPPDFQPVYYKYVYKGEPLAFADDKRPVLKRMKPDNLADLSGLMDALGLGMVNLRSFGNSKLQSISLGEENGYSINVDAVNGSISISGYWPKTLMMETGAAQQPELADVPENQILIGIANDFMSAHGISLEGYSEPEVLDEWKLFYEMSVKQGSPIYFPEVINVVYPLKINDQVVLDESGNKTGIVVAVDIRNKKVASVWDLSTRNYQSSLYDAETDAAKIIEVAGRGGVYGYYPSECSTPLITPDGRSISPKSACKIVEVELGSPIIQPVKMWNYRDNQSQELLIPSVVFPILNAPDELYYRKTVVVPLIKEFLNNQNVPYPMPLEKMGM
ncbi:MAG: hypothetical protein HY336_01065 [Candidatus Doudnabacteria bacterium]|nr:hypothetical protein [Candidatus Doudnabacteria bacterium]